MDYVQKLAIYVKLQTRKQANAYLVMWDLN